MHEHPLKKKWHNVISSDNFWKKTILPLTFWTTLSLILSYYSAKIVGGQYLIIDLLKLEKYVEFFFVSRETGITLFKERRVHNWNDIVKDFRDMMSHTFLKNKFHLST